MHHHASMPQTSLVDMLVRASKHILESGGVVRSLQTQPLDALPFRIKAHNAYHYHARCATC